jgi:hypothetical protein
MNHIFTKPNTYNYICNLYINLQFQVALQLIILQKKESIATQNTQLPQKSFKNYKNTGLVATADAIRQQLTVKLQFRLMLQLHTKPNEMR